MTGVALRTCATCGVQAAASLLKIGVPHPLDGETYGHIYRCRDRTGCTRRAARNLQLVTQ